LGEDDCEVLADLDDDAAPLESDLEDGGDEGIDAGGDTGDRTAVEDPPLPPGCSRLTTDNRQPVRVCSGCSAPR
jgi:hypothetical protein